LNAPLKFGKINSDRAFAFRKKGIKSLVDYNEFIDKLYIRL
jgi:hypothetical protein